ncbi:MAG: DUF445 domain-containing protein [Flammeovirgaceae bacterium]
MAEENWQILLFWLPYVLIPIINAIVGWGTNWLALKMTFYPLEFLGIPPYLGWQGIIPNKAASMAEKSVDMLTEKLIDSVELFERMDPARVAEEMKEEVDALSEKIINEVMLAQAPLLWKPLPKRAKRLVYEKASENLPETVAEMMDDIKVNIDELFNVKQMTIDILLENKQLLNDIFEECGKEEFVFIERSGIYFGFLFGMIQTILWYFVQQNGWMSGFEWTLLPAFGLLVGWATNFIALKIIFYPLNPIKIGPIRIQGLFIKRQYEVAEIYSRIVAENILNMPNIFDEIIRGHTQDKLTEVIRKHIDHAVDEAVGSSKTIFEFMAGKKKIEIAKNIATYRFMEELPVSIRKIFGYADEALDVETTLCEKMQTLTPVEFEGFLHPVFEEDEWKLILVGAVLGGLAGTAQLFMF